MRYLRMMQACSVAAGEEKAGGAHAAEGKREKQRGAASLCSNNRIHDEGAAALAERLAWLTALQDLDLR